jgi:hypothetical protein
MFRAELLERLGRLDEALRCVNDVIRTRPMDVEPAVAEKLRDEIQAALSKTAPR